jgi:hypothetical protein
MTITIESGITVGQGIYIGDIPATRLPKTITPIQNGRVSTAQVKFGTGSLSNSGGLGGLRVTPTTGFGFGTGDFTIEYWYYPTSYTDSLGVDMRPAATQGAYPSIGPRATGSTIYYTSASFKITSSTTATPLNTWNSIALVRYQGNTRMYINGVQEGSTFVDNTNYAQGNCTIGCNGYDGTAGTFPIKGYLDEIRISNVARYTGPYTPATQPFVNDPYTLLLVHCDGTNGSSVFTDSVQPE